MSKDTWELLEKPTLKLAPKHVATPTNTFGKCLGIVNASIGIKIHLVKSDFYVVDSKDLHAEVVLGYDWL